MSLRPAITRQRLPFLGLLLAAFAGILVSHFSGWPSWIFLAGSGASCAVWLFTRRALWIHVAVGCAFGCVHTWQTRESVSWRLEEMVGSGNILCTATGAVDSDPAPFGEGRERFTLGVRSMAIDGGEFPCPADVVVTVKSPAPARGDRIRVTGTLAGIPPPRNPGAFDERAWMHLHGITCGIEAAAPMDVIILRPSPWYSIPSIASRCRSWMERTLRVGIGDDPVVCDLLAGMALGVTSSIPEALQQDFRNTGTFHLFSVSGLHVGMIGLILWQILKLAGIKRRWAVAAIIPALFFYALITGWKPSSLRAAVMSSIFLIGLTSSRRPVPVNSLCAAGFLILVQWTNELFNPGFQLSFLVVLAILLWAVPLHDAIRRRAHPDPFVPRQLWTRWQQFGTESAGQLGGLFSVSLAAWAGSLPLTLAYFHMVSLSALPANLVIVPLAFVIMVTACLALTGGLVSGFLAAVFNNANWAFTKILLAVVQMAAAMPLSHFLMGVPETIPAAITVFDFGAGGAVAIESGGRIWMLDSGPGWAGDSVIKPWLCSRGRDAPDGLILTHGDARHIGGAAALAGSRTPPLVVDSVLNDRSPVRGKLHRRLQELGIPKSLMRAGDGIRIDRSTTMTVLHPPPGLIKNEADDKVLVVRLDAGKSKILFLSDAGPATQEWLLDHLRDGLRADILVAGRHRSGIMIGSEFVDAVHPRAIVSTATHFPQSEAPDPLWEAWLAGRKIPLIRQDMTGAVRIEVRRDRVRVLGFSDGSELVLPVEPR